MARCAGRGGGRVYGLGYRAWGVGFCIGVGVCGGRCQLLGGLGYIHVGEMGLGERVRGGEGGGG